MQRTGTTDTTTSTINKHYTKLPSSVTAQRNAIKNLLDDFCTFSWNSTDAFDEFGAFIINEKDGLKFYNGPSFSNQYSKPQFDSAVGNLTGVTFQQQTISFKICVYCITATEYQKFLRWLNPYEVGYLSFSFNSKFRYLVKLNGIKDSPRNVMGKYNNEYYYWTEMDLSFDVIGQPCAIASIPHVWETEKSITNQQVGVNYKSHLKTTITKTVNDNTVTQANSDYIESIKEFPFKYNFTIKPSTEADTCGEAHVTLWAEYTINSSASNKVRLFDLGLFNLTTANPTTPTTDNPLLIQNQDLTITYDSESGLIFFTSGDTYVLNLLTLSSTGDYVVSNIDAVKFMIPGADGTFDPSKLYLVLEVKRGSITTYTEGSGQSAKTKPRITVESYARAYTIA